MASSNRHWPSMFKSKPCNNQHQDHHPSSLLASNNTTCARSSSITTAFPFSSGCEERSPEPKPRWNPKPEQIRILEAIFNSGMVNPPRDEIRRIRAQLLEYGQVGDANVFYWFQNRKSRSKHKQRTLQAKINATALSGTGTGNGTQNSLSLPASSSSSSSDKASPQKAATLSGSGGGGGSSSYGSASASSGNNYNSSISVNNVVVDQFGNSPTSVNQPSPYFHPLVPPHLPNTTTTTTTTSCIQDHQPLFFPLHQNGATHVIGNFSQGLCFGTNTTHHDHHYEDHHHHHHHPLPQINLDVPQHSDQTTVGGFSSLLLGDHDEVEKLKFQQQLSSLVTNPSSATTNSPSPAYAFPNSLAQILGVGDSSVAPKSTSTVYINGMAVEIAVGHVNVKEFGETALLVNTETGEVVATNEWGVTLHPLHHAASYYLVNGSSASASGPASPSLLLHHKHHNDPGFPYQI